MDKITHEVRLTQWKKVIEEYHARPEGQTAKSVGDVLLARIMQEVRRA